MSGFLFVDDPVAVARSVSGAKAILDDAPSTQHILDGLKKQLQFPGYFGNNWDALAECLRGLGWLSARNVTIVHATLPLIGDDDLRRYVSALECCADFWQTAEEHVLTVIFPTSAAPRVTAALARARLEVI